MKCPFCGDENIAGADTCESCGEDLTAFDGVRPRDSLEKALVRDAVLDAANCSTWITTPDTPIIEAAKRMDKDNNCCLVMEGEKLLGVVTVRDILQKVVLTDLDIHKTPISEIMTPNPDFLTWEDKLVHVLNKMAIGRFRHVPIQRPDHSYQVISVRDILAYIANKFPHITGTPHE